MISKFEKISNHGEQFIRKIQKIVRFLLVEPMSTQLHFILIFFYDLVKCLLSKFSGMTVDIASSLSIYLLIIHNSFCDAYTVFLDPRLCRLGPINSVPSVCPSVRPFYYPLNLKNGKNTQKCIIYFHLLFHNWKDI